MDWVISNPAKCIWSPLLQRPEGRLSSVRPVRIAWSVDLLPFLPYREVVKEWGQVSAKPVVPDVCAGTPFPCTVGRRIGCVVGQRPRLFLLDTLFVVPLGFLDDVLATGVTPRRATREHIAAHGPGWLLELAPHRHAFPPLLQSDNPRVVDVEGMFLV